MAIVYPPQAPGAVLFPGRGTRVIVEISAGDAD